MELDELVAGRLLDNARLLARLCGPGQLTEGQLLDLMEANDLDSVLVLDARARPVRRVGSSEPFPLERAEIAAVAAGRMTEAVIGWGPAEAGGHVGAVAARPEGGAVVAVTHVSRAYALASQLGVANLLASTVGTGGVLFLAYRELPDGANISVAWDGGTIPEPDPEGAEFLTLRGREAFEVSVPISVPAGRTASLRIGFDARPVLRATASAMRRTALVGVVLAAFGLAGLGFTLVSRARARESAESARRLAEAEEKRLRSERLAAAGALAAGVAHEVRNPLNSISLAAQRIARKHPADTECARFAGRIREEVVRLEDIVKGFLDLARPASGPRSVTDLNEVVGEVVALLETEAAEGGISLSANGSEAWAVVDREAVRRAVVNLLRNAIQVAPSDSRVEVSVETDRSLARIRVRDRGPGVEPEFAERAFDPFVTSRAEGIGLGLALVRRVAEEHGGWAKLEPRDGGGTVATLEVHVAADEERAR
jgi:signal transduction histidine kinase